LLGDITVANLCSVNDHSHLTTSCRIIEGCISIKKFFNYIEMLGKNPEQFAGKEVTDHSGKSMLPGFIS
jgi:dihydroorotase-like cyclic amidohydrolase